MKTLIVDTETTGLTREDEMVEFAGLLLERQGNRLWQIARYDGLLKPGCRINRHAERPMPVDVKAPWPKTRHVGVGGI